MGIRMCGPNHAHAEPNLSRSWSLHALPDADSNPPNEDDLDSVTYH
jgi:hypothetical protein